MRKFIVKIYELRNMGYLERTREYFSITNNTFEKCFPTTRRLFPYFNNTTTQKVAKVAIIIITGVLIIPAIAFSYDLVKLIVSKIFSTTPPPSIAKKAATLVKYVPGLCYEKKKEIAMVGGTLYLQSLVSNYKAYKYLIGYPLTASATIIPLLKLASGIPVVSKLFEFKNNNNIIFYLSLSAISTIFYKLFLRGGMFDSSIIWCLNSQTLMIILSVLNNITESSQS